VLLKDSATTVKNPIVPIKDNKDPREDTVFQKAKASG
jgi:hypothetical protein